MMQRLAWEVKQPKSVAIRQIHSAQLIVVQQQLNTATLKGISGMDLLVVALTVQVSSIVCLTGTVPLK